MAPTSNMGMPPVSTMGMAPNPAMGMAPNNMAMGRLSFFSQFLQEFL